MNSCCLKVILRHSLYRGYFVCQIDGLFQIDAQENNKRENNEQREQKYRYDFTRAEWI